MEEVSALVEADISAVALSEVTGEVWLTEESAVTLAESFPLGAAVSARGAFEGAGVVGWVDVLDRSEDIAVSLTAPVTVPLSKG